MTLSTRRRWRFDGLRASREEQNGLLRASCARRSVANSRLERVVELCRHGTTHGMACESMTQTSGDRFQMI